MHRLVPSLLLPLLLLAPACLSSAPPLRVRSFTLLPDPGLVAEDRAARWGAGGWTVEPASAGIDDRFAWHDPATGELGRFEAWRWVEHPEHMVVKHLQDRLEPKPMTEPVQFRLHALWGVRGSTPMVRLAFSIRADGVPESSSFVYDETAPVDPAADGPEGHVRALRELLDDAAQRAHSWWTTGAEGAR